MQDTQCDGRTHEDKRCSKQGKILVEEGKHLLCWTHWRSWAGPERAKVPVWEILGMTVAPDEEKLTRLTVKTIAATLRDGPPAPLPLRGSGDGSIYVYRLETDRNDDMFKIGFTTTTVEKRLQDWPGSQLVDSWETPYPHYVETLIHLFLQHWRCYRFVFRDWDARKRFVSVWYDDPTSYVQDCVATSRRRPLWLDTSLWERVHKGEICPQLNVKSKRADRFDVEKEWFYVSYSYIKPVIGGIIEVVQRNHRDWHESFRWTTTPPAEPEVLSSFGSTEDVD